MRSKNKKSLTELTFEQASQVKGGDTSKVDPKERNLKTHESSTKTVHKPLLPR